MPLWLPVLLMVTGVVLVVRAIAIVATKGGGRFRADPLVSIVLGFRAHTPRSVPAYMIGYEPHHGRRHRPGGK